MAQADCFADEYGDIKLKIITDVFRPFVVENLNLTSEFLSLLYSKNGLNHETMGHTEQLLREASPVNVLLDRLARLNRKGTYTAFIECLRSKGSAFIADAIEDRADVDSEALDLLKHLIQAFHEQLNQIDPASMLPYLRCLNTEEKESIRQTTHNFGDTRGAVFLLGIICKKGKVVVGQLMKGLRETGHGNLAQKLSKLFCCSTFADGEMDDNCCGASSTCTGAIVDDPNMFQSGTPAENTSGFDEPSASGACALKPGELIRSSDRDTPEDDSLDGEPKLLRLRGYQEELVAASLQGTNSLVVAPTNSGKTYVAARLVQAFLDRESGVGPRFGNPPQVIKDGSNKVVFLVNNVLLVDQHLQVIQLFMSDNSIMGLSGETSNPGSLVDLLDEHDVLVMTAQILVNALQGVKDDNERLELSKIGLLVFDECHHCQKGAPYNKIMSQYCDIKLSSPQTHRPQVLGLTASMGVGKASNLSEAESHIMKMCANLDVEKICTVQDQQNKEELRQIRDKPEEDIFEVPGRKNNGFAKAIVEIMEKIEARISQIPEGETWLKQPKPRYGTQGYEQWLVEMGKHFIEHVANDENGTRLATCKDHLKEYNACLYINRDARTQDALDHIKNFLESLELKTTSGFSPYEQQLVDFFQSKQKCLKALAESSLRDLQNPLLDRLTKILTETLLGRADSRGILFCKTRATTKALHAWLQATPSLQCLQAGILIGSGGTEGMTTNKQGEFLDKFREGKHRLMVATSVAEEGLDIQQCNVVICCNYISNEIGRVQAQGRSRARGGKYFLVVSEELTLTSREIQNRIREKMMYKATDSLQEKFDMNPKAFLEKIVEIQEMNRNERQARERALARLQHNKELMDVSLICRKCRRHACTLDDLRCIKKNHHVVLNAAFLKQCRLVPHNKPCQLSDIEKLKRIMCGKPTCPQKWGSQMKFNDCVVFALSPTNFIFQPLHKNKRGFKEWKLVPYKIAKMDMEELREVSFTMEVEEDNINEDDGDIWAPL
ncbi:probable ATP-dependent RNA helicase DHX58 [Patiria miniata]|uniref:RNA helicase n=1 Tax=Patiria miniata TaxID=46514 RepID=A0A913Z3A5_PATMI|nr:probable ATP-dependent RNA helicase DHX58 [Patiria miniata]